jgi:hypothetical protein
LVRNKDGKSIVSCCFGAGCNRSELQHVADAKFRLAPASQPAEKELSADKSRIGAGRVLKPGRFREILIGQRQSAFQCSRANLRCRSILNHSQHTGNAGGVFRSLRAEVANATQILTGAGLSFHMVEEGPPGRSALCRHG